MCRLHLTASELKQDMYLPTGKYKLINCSEHWGWVFNKLPQVGIVRLCFRTATGAGGWVRSWFVGSLKMTRFRAGLEVRRPSDTFLGATLYFSNLNSILPRARGSYERVILNAL